ncbi:MAG: hypothetical protein ACRECH_17315, partial [Nitrososphaerales archaeon]
TISFSLMAILEPSAVDHIEHLRTHRPKRDVELKLNFVIKSISSSISSAHLREVSRSEMPQQLKTLFDQIPSVTGRPATPDSLIVFEFDTNFSPSRNNMWVLSSDESAKVLSFSSTEIEIPATIHNDEWIHDYLPVLKRINIISLELPASQSPNPATQHLTEAAEELKHAERAVLEGSPKDVLGSVRNVILNHLLTELDSSSGQRKRSLNPEVKKSVLSAAPSSSLSTYESILDVIEGSLRQIAAHLGKFIHLDTGKLELTPLREDAEYLYSATLALTRYLSQISVKA